MNEGMEENPYEPPRIPENSQPTRRIGPMLSGIGWLYGMLNSAQSVFVLTCLALVVLGTLTYNVQLLLDWLF